MTTFSSYKSLTRQTCPACSRSYAADLQKGYELCILLVFPYMHIY